VAEALAMVRKHPGGFCEAYPPRVVNNVYLDTPSLQAFQDHVNGISNRVKTRVRWYGKDGGTSAISVLEWKLKRGLVGTKVSHPLPGSAWHSGNLAVHLAHAAEQPALPASLRAGLRHLAPSLSNRYRRFYFKTMDGQIRLTVDTELQFGSPPNGKVFEEQLNIKLSTVVIELKFDPRHAAQASRICQHLPVRLTRCSKYVLGIEKLHQDT
jgi:hypothetical protein